MAVSRSGNPHITVLLAEDEPPLRSLLTRVFENNGFTVLVAEDGEKALGIAHEYKNGIDLLVSNVQMPNMTGPELARALRESRPELRIMLISGFQEGLLVLDKGWVFLQKPFLPKAIVDKVYELMAVPPASRTEASDAGTSKNSAGMR